MNKLIFRPNDKIESNPDNHNWMSNVLHDQLFKLFLRDIKSEEQVLLLAKAYGYSIKEIAVIRRCTDKNVYYNLTKLKTAYKKYFNIK